MQMAMDAVVDLQPLTKKKVAHSGSWALLDSNGETQTLDADKYAIMRRVGIHARDLRILDPVLSQPSTILVRNQAILLNLEHIKAIITAEEVLLRNPSDKHVIPIMEELCRRLPKGSATQRTDILGDGQEQLNESHYLDAGDEDESPFEFRALEVALEAICSLLDASATELECQGYPLLDEITSKISCHNLERVNRFKNRLTRLTTRVQKVRDELKQLLDDEDDMAGLYLSRKLAGASLRVGGSVSPNWAPASPTIGSRIGRASRASDATTHGKENDVEELEMLLEAYLVQVDGTLNKLTTLREYADDSESYNKIQLDNQRNQLIQLDLLLSSVAVAVSIYSMVTGIFSMNIPNPWNANDGYLFNSVVVLTGLFCIGIFSIIMAYARHKGLIGT